MLLSAWLWTPHQLIDAALDCARGSRFPADGLDCERDVITLHCPGALLCREPLPRGGADAGGSVSVCVDRHWRNVECECMVHLVGMQRTRLLLGHVQFGDEGVLDRLLFVHVAQRVHGQLQLLQHVAAVLHVADIES